MRKLTFILFSLILLLSKQGLAHHSFPVHFVPDEIITVSGIVTDFKFNNPHGVVSFSVTDETGNEVVWRAETNSPSMLRRRGWSKESVAIGDKVTIKGWPARDGSPRMRLNYIALPDGSELTPGGLVD